MLSSVIPVFGIAKLLKSVMKCEGCICSPKTLTAWQNTNKKDHLDGVDGITDESKVMCFYGGIITINEAKESADDAQSADEDGKVSGRGQVHHLVTGVRERHQNHQRKECRQRLPQV